MLTPTLVGILVLLNLVVLARTLADARYQPYDWAGAARCVRLRWRTGDALVFYPQAATVAFGYYFRQPAAGAVTIYAPPWGDDWARLDWIHRLPPAAALTGCASRVGSC